jgi:hypothetical protein
MQILAQNLLYLPRPCAFAYVVQVDRPWQRLGRDPKMLGMILDMRSMPPEYTEEFKHSMAVLLGLVRGVLADNILNPQEILALNSWLSNHQELLHEWPANVIAERVQAVLADGVITQEEIEDLAETLTRVLGWGFNAQEHVHPWVEILSQEPQPEVIVPGRSFLLSGRFLYGPRGRCDAATLECGGLTDKAVNGALDYVVVGALTQTTPPEEESSALIAAALDLQSSGHGIKVIPEQAWHAGLHAS